MESNLPYLWFFLLSGMLVLFITLTGSDLGLGMISLLQKEREKVRTIENVGPQWYANETWLVIAGGTLFGAFPHAYGLILSSLYIPVMMLIFGLILRAVSTEFRNHVLNRNFWNWGFGVGCLLASLGQGLLLGGLITNPGAVSIVGIGTWNWLNPISMLIAVGVTGAFTMIGSARVISRQTKDIAPEVWRFLRYGSMLSAAVFLILTVFIVAVPSSYNTMWSEGHRVILVPLFSIITFSCLFIVLLRSYRQIRGRWPYFWSAAAFLSVTGTLIAMVYPYIIPFSSTIPGAASPESTQFFMLFGVGVVLPVIIFYNLYIARVFSRTERKNPTTG